MFGYKNRLRYRRERVLQNLATFGNFAKTCVRIREGGLLQLLSEDRRGVDPHMGALQALCVAIQMITNHKKEEAGYGPLRSCEKGFPAEKSVPCTSSCCSDSIV